MSEKEDPLQTFARESISGLYNKGETEPIQATVPPYEKKEATPIDKVNEPSIAPSHLEKSEGGFFKKPWLWIGVGVAVLGGLFLIPSEKKAVVKEAVEATTDAVVEKAPAVKAKATEGLKEAQEAALKAIDTTKETARAALPAIGEFRGEILSLGSDLKELIRKEVGGIKGVIVDTIRQELSGFKSSMAQVVEDAVRKVLSEQFASGWETIHLKKIEAWERIKKKQIQEFFHSKRLSGERRLCLSFGDETQCTRIRVEDQLPNYDKVPLRQNL